MERVVRLLDPRQPDDFSPRQAWLRLWVLAGDQPRLNAWEQQRDTTAFDAQVEELMARIEEEQPVPLALAQANTLALIRALDRWLAYMHRPAGRSLATGHAQMTYEESGRRYWLMPVTQAAHRGAAMATQVTQRALWFHHHVAIPCRTLHGLDITLQHSSGPLDAALSNLARAPHGELKAWVAHFKDGADVVWSQDIGKARNWRTVSVEPSGQRCASITDTLQQAQGSGAVVVVFPEFTVDLAQRQTIIDHLIQCVDGSVQLVVAGSFHEPMSGADPLQAYNTAPVLGANGQALFTHRKLRLFGDEAHGAECAQIGNTLHVLSTPLGAMTVMICKDFLDGDDRVRTALHEVPVDWVWVPSYGNATTLKLHKQRARELARTRVGLSTVVAQTQNTAMDKDGPPLPGFGHAAAQEDPVEVGDAGGLVSLAWRHPPAAPSSEVKRHERPLRRIK